MLLKKGNPAFREWKQSQQGQKMLGSKLTQVLGRMEFPNQESAVYMSKAIGCAGIHMKRAGVWAPCENPEVLNRVAPQTPMPKKTPGVPTPRLDLIRDHGHMRVHTK